MRGAWRQTRPVPLAKEGPLSHGLIGFGAASWLQRAEDQGISCRDGWLSLALLGRALFYFSLFEFFLKNIFLKRGEKRRNLKLTMERADETGRKIVLLL